MRCPKCGAESKGPYCDYCGTEMVEDSVYESEYNNEDYWEKKKDSDNSEIIEKREEQKSELEPEPRSAYIETKKEEKVENENKKQVFSSEIKDIQVSSYSFKDKENAIYKPWIWIVSGVLCLYGIGFIIIAILVGFIIYSKIYFNGNEFKRIKLQIKEYIDECNELNKHIEDLKGTYVTARKTDYGDAVFTNISKYNYKKKGLNAKFAPNTYDCSRQVCGNAQKQPFKYICKYFNIKADEETLNQFEEVINNFSAAEEGKILLAKKRYIILANLKKKIPGLIRGLFAKDLDKNLGFEEVSFNELYFPKFIFRYISSGGNSGSQFSITMDIPMLERFVTYINENVTKRKSAKGQRALMTPKLRNYIKQRDDFTCKNCGNSVYQEPNLLLEIDHIIPIAQGGLTEETNLQTLCWKCNRTKGSKILVG